jgi:hypothetical protein
MNHIAERSVSPKVAREADVLSLQARIVCEGGFTPSLSKVHPEHQLQPKSNGNLVLLH